jgi:diaminopropionate ammonia-lyase
MPDWSGEELSFLRNVDMWDFHRILDGYQATPLTKLPKIADNLMLSEVWTKDESHRFQINAFKPLGASYAIYRFLKSRWQEKFDEPFGPQAFGDPAMLDRLGKFTFCAASDGNHGKAVAWTAKRLRQKAVIYMPGETVPARIESIRAEGAEVVVLPGSYDDCVIAAEKDARAYGWYAISDTAYEGNMTIPSWVMNGYSTLFREMETALHTEDDPGVDFVFLQAGVGAFAASGAAYYKNKYGAAAPTLICVEPLEAAGYLDSMTFGDGKAIAARGKMETIMAGLNCGVPSAVAWPILKDSITLFLAISDDYAKDAMRLYAESGVVSGESGASGLAGLIALCKAPELAEAKEQIGLGPKSRVLLINTEGDTDPESYNRIVRGKK